MLRLVNFDETAMYMFPNGEVADAAKIKAHFPAVEHFPHVLEVNGDVCQAVMSLTALRNLHSIDSSLSESEALAALETIINTVPEEVVTAEERIAAAMEYQNLLSL